MRVFYDPIQTSHNPEGMLMRGKRQAFPEAPERLDYFLNGLRSLDLEPKKPGDYSRDIVTAIHDPGYVDFLQSGYEEWSALANASSEIIPNTHPGRHMNTIPAHIVGRAGYYMADQACPIGPQTWLAAKASADCAVAATDSVLAGDAVAFALCRPPGHHAFADLAGGFCYLNNVAIAAQRALDQGAKRVAILDVDVHHGNGTQGIFYDRDDVLFVSLHGDPDIFSPSSVAMRRKPVEGQAKAAI